MATRRDTLVRAGLAAALTASLGLLAASGEPPDPVARAPTSSELRERGMPAAESPQALRADLLQRGAQEAAAKDLFAAHSWYRPPAPPPPQKSEPSPAPPPAAPPLPFTFLGTFESAGGKPTVYLVEGDQVHAVSEGEVVNGLYRVEALGTDELVLLYLPLAIRHTLALGSGK